MVSLEGAKAAEPLVDQIEKLQVYHDTLDLWANDPTSELWKIDLQIYLSQVNNSLLINEVFNHTDTAAILFSLRNIIGTKISTLTNELGAIT